MRGCKAGIMAPLNQGRGIRSCYQRHLRIVGDPPTGMTDGYVLETSGAYEDTPLTYTDFSIIAPLIVPWQLRSDGERPTP